MSVTAAVILATLTALVVVLAGFGGFVGVRRLLS